MIQKVWKKGENSETIYLFTLKNEDGTELEIINYGARIRRLLVPDKNHQLQDVVLGYESLDSYLKDETGMGAVIGRNANRLSQARYEIEGKVYELEKNEYGTNNLHTGKEGFQYRIWEYVPNKSNDQVLTLRLMTKHLQDGFPGTLSAEVSYELTSDNKVIISYQGSSTHKTVFNPTNHTYFNLAGERVPNVLKTHQLYIDAKGYTPLDAQNIPTGEILPTAGHYDFSKLDYPKIPLDFNFVLNPDSCFEDKAVTLYCPDSGIQLDVYTTTPAIQVYTSNALDIKEPIGLNGTLYPPYSGICLETQYTPDHGRHPHFPSPVIEADEYTWSKTIFHFS